MERKLVECKKCGWQWFPRIENPKECPNCHSKFWNVGRQRKAAIKTNDELLEQGDSN